jgi:hypothetical protein
VLHLGLKTSLFSRRPQQRQSTQRVLQLIRPKGLKTSLFSKLHRKIDSHNVSSILKGSIVATGAAVKSAIHLITWAASQLHLAMSQCLLALHVNNTQPQHLFHLSAVYLASPRGLYTGTRTLETSITEAERVGRKDKTRKRRA